MKKFHWFEAKQLDRVTNYSTELEMLKYANKNFIKAYYYCSFSKRKEYYGFKNNIRYLGFFRNKYLKFIEFHLIVFAKSLQIVFNERNSVIMVNQDLILNLMPAFCINKLLKKGNKFITDIRTTPTSPDKFELEMKKFHYQFGVAVKYFDGFSFITPFMEKYLMTNYYKQNYKSVNWSSGADIELFNPEKYQRKRGQVFQLFYHGGISISRGNLNIIKAIQELIIEGYDLELVQVGICVDKEIVQYIEKNHLNEWCKLLPPVPLTEIPQLIANCDLPVLPFPNFMAWRVSSPIKLMEYLAMGKRVLAPNMEAFVDVFGECSELVFYFDTYLEDQIEALKIGIKTIIDKKVLLQSNYSTQARSFVSNNFTWDKQASNLFNFCESL